MIQVNRKSDCVAAIIAAPYIKVVATMLICAGSSFAQAQAQQRSGWYIEGAIGAVSGSRSTSEFSDELLADGVTVTDITIDDNRAGWQLNLGYELTDNLAIELGYLDLKEVSITLTAAVTDAELFISKAQNIHPDSAEGVTLAGIYRYHINDDFGLSGSLGVLRWNGEFNSHSLTSGEQLGSADNSGTDLYYGLGGGYKMTEDLSLVIEWQHFKLDSDSVHMWSAGARYRF